MPKKVITPSVHKNICQRLHRFDQQYLQQQIDTLQILIDRMDNLRWRKWLDNAQKFTMKKLKKVKKITAKQYQDPGIYKWTLKNYMYRTIMPVLPSLMEGYPKLKSPHRDVSDEHIQPFKLKWDIVNFDLVEKDYLLRIKSEEGFHKQNIIKLKKKHYISKMSMLEWKDDIPIVFNAKQWVGSTAERYAKKRERLLESLQTCMHYKWEQYHGTQPSVQIIYDPSIRNLKKKK